MILPQEPAAAAADTAVSVADAIWLGIVEGLTEFLPVSSTGHLIVTNRLLGLAETPLTVGIQLGAISAILVLYWRRLWDAARRMVTPAKAGTRQPNLLLQIVIAALPAAVLGLLFDDLIEGYLFSAEFVAATMTIGGLLLLWLEQHLARRARRNGGGADAPGGGADLAAMSYRTALWVGMFQCLALLPGTSRSGATIAGALLLGLSRTAAAEFSFLVGLPILYGACGVKLLTDWDAFAGPLLLPMLVGTVVSFLSALVVVRPFVAFLRRHTFAPFAIYRLVAGLLLAAGCAANWL
ncbi:MAG: undecaprenyl-diphosphate phosphatase [Planctomycetota bacterium]